MRFVKDEADDRILSVSIFRFLLKSKKYTLSDFSGFIFEVTDPFDENECKKALNAQTDLFCFFQHYATVFSDVFGNSAQLLAE